MGVVARVAVMATVALLGDAVVRGGKSASSKARLTCGVFLILGGLEYCLGLLFWIVVTIAHAFNLSAYAVDAAVRIGLSSWHGVMWLSVVMSILSVMCCAYISTNV